MKIDAEQEPPFLNYQKHKAATWLLAPQAPKVTPPEEIQRRWAIFKEKQNILTVKEELLMPNKLLEVKGLKQYFNVGKRMKYML